MSFIEMPGLADAKEPEIVAEGVYDLVIVDAKLKEKERKKNIFVVIEIEGYPEAANVMHNVSLVKSDDDEDTRKFKNLFAARFFNQFSIVTEGGVELEQLVGHRASAAKLTVDTYEGTKKNVLKLDPLPTEESES